MAARKNLGDPWVLEVQQWLNKTFGSNPNYGTVAETGQTGWDTVYGIIRAIQLELKVTDTPVNNFGAGTAAAWDNQVTPNLAIGYKNGNIVKLIDAGFRCKGMGAGKFDDTYSKENVSALIELKKAAGFSKPDSKFNSMWARALFDMSAFVLVPGGDERTRQMQQDLNNKYYQWTGILPCDGIYQRATNTALIYGVQVEEGLGDIANGVFGPTTQKDYGEIAGNHQLASYPGLVTLIQYALYQNLINVLPSSVPFSGSLDVETSFAIGLFQSFLHLKNVETGYPDLSTVMSLLLSSGDPNRSFTAVDTAAQLTPAQIETLKKAGIKYVGRYLTGTVGSEFKPKYLTIGEANNIIGAGMAIIPIYQDNFPTVDYYTYGQGVSDARSAFAAADNLGFSTDSIIYFAVDVDALDSDITTNIIPYFNGLFDTMNYNRRYNIGIYGTRNACMRVVDAGYAVASYVSNMSTGWSGNLGFSQPASWSFDQFDEPADGIGTGAGLVMIDKVNVSGTDSGVTAVSKKDPAVSMLRGLGIKLINDILDSQQFEFGKEFVIFEWGIFKLTQTLAAQAQSPDAQDFSLKFSIMNGKLDPAFTAKIEDVLGSGITAKLEDSVSGLTSAIETGDAEFSGGYKDGVISGSITFNMTKNTVDGTEITTSVKYNLEIDLGKIGKPFQDAFDWIESIVSNEYFQKFIVVLGLILVAGFVVSGGVSITAAAAFSVIISTLTSLMSSIKF
ncbi:DUF1906 domain-containing protein [Enterococcus faecalis]|uniref:glycoside hydrolase domain-containing protein n=2 Tax=Enterococcus faecalis TaxID=1351 RepID=UPI00114444A3|nr:glycoside hydrolase domain-containing protein [Enterococcus faecalis]EGO9400084.1 hypothetical protein [Enterococcus faecalis]EGO9465995.1 hypothetical protein [Enterococcus faecalis]EHZ5160288.1 DUF1906 domain-containing protein [Enterococcus faecalis]EIA0404858.1 DUF1906 domain-containing protein [Enterococcus faecalis]EKR9293334.1 DUF1906 domain-containing protein [Enterococcus faecalis]